MNFSQWAVTPFVWLAVVMTVIPLVVLVVHSVMQHRAILRGVAQQRAREARLLCCATAGGCMNIRRKTACGLPVPCWQGWR